MDFKKLRKKWWFWVIAFFAVCLVLYPFMPHDEEQAPVGAVSPSPASTLEASATPAPSPVLSSEPGTSQLLAADISIADVMNGAKTDKIGEWACITVKKADAQKVSMDEFVSFVNERVKDSGYNWWTIVFEDGTGIQFAGSTTLGATYGTLDNEGCIIKSVGTVFLKDGKYEYAPDEDTQQVNEPVTETGGNASPTPEPTPEPTPTPKATSTPAQTNDQGTYVGSTDSDKYHYPSCRAAKKIDAGNEIWFGSKEEAQAAGYSSCGICSP